MNEYSTITTNEFDKGRVNWLNYCDRGRFRPLLYVASTGGMCNRIFGLASAMSKAVAEGRLLKVYWPLNGEDGTSVRWSDLFTNEIDLFTEWDLYWIMDIAHEVAWHHRIENACSTFDTTNIVVVKSQTAYFDELPGDKLDQRIDLSVGLSWLMSLTIQPDILEKVKDFCLPRNTLGVHLRVHEERFQCDYFKENPINPELLKKIDDWQGAVLVMSNSPTAKMHLAKIFGSKILQQEDIKYERDSTGCKSAMVDLLLLSRCVERIGNNSSTFFMLANRWSNKKFP